MNKDLIENGLDTRFSSKNQPINRGRPKSQFKNYVKEIKTSSEDIALLAKHIMGMSQKQLILLIDNEKQPLLARIIAKAFFADFAAGRFNNTEMILRRIYGEVKITEIIRDTGEEEKFDYSQLSTDEIEMLIKIRKKLVKENL